MSKIMSRSVSWGDQVRILLIIAILAALLLVTLPTQAAAVDAGAAEAVIGQVEDGAAQEISFLGAGGLPARTANVSWNS